MPTFTGSSGADVITPTVLSPGVVHDAPFPGAGADTLNGGLGNDTLDGGGGSDSISGGAGNDLINANFAAVAAPMGAGDGPGGPAGGDSDSPPPLAFSSPTVDAGAGDDTVNVAVANGVSGHLTLDGGTGVDTLNLAPGGPGTFSFQQATAGGHASLTFNQAASVLGVDSVNVENIHVAAANLSAASFVTTAGADNIILQQLGSDLLVQNSATSTVFLNSLAAGAGLQISTGDGNDTIDASRLGATGHAQTLNAGAGNDTLFVSNSVVNAGDGDDVITWLRGGADTIDGGAGNDTQSIVTQGAADTITLSANGGHVIESLDGQAQDVVHVETLNIATGDRADLVNLSDLSATDVKTININLAGSAGGPDGAVDTVNLAPAAAGSQVSFSHGADGTSLTATYSAGGVVSQTVNITGLDATDVVHLAGGVGNDTFNVSPLTSHAQLAIDGAAGSDTQVITGSSAADQISIAASGAHVLEQVNGSPLDVVGVETITVKPLEGTDALRIGNLAGTDVRHLNIDLTGADGLPDHVADTLNFSGETEVSINGSPDGTAMSLSFTARDGSIVVADVTGLDSSDHVTFGGTAGDDAFHFLNSVLKNVSFDLGDGNDLVEGGLSNSVVNTGAGDDKVVALEGQHGSHNAIDTGAGQDSIFERGISDIISGGDGNDTITDAGFFTLDVVPSMNTLLGGSGDDRIAADAFGDTVSGGDGADTITAFLSGHTVLGDAGNDSITLAATDSTVSGGDGNDTFFTTDQFGGNTLHGDAGDDEFQFFLTFQNDQETTLPFFDGGSGSDTMTLGNEPADQFLLHGSWIETVGAKATALGIVAEFNETHTFLSPLDSHIVTASSTGDMANVETLNLATSTGPDHVLVNDLTGSGVTLVNIDLGPAGVHLEGDFLVPSPPGPDGVSDLVDLSGSAAADHVSVNDFTSDGSFDIVGLPASVHISNEDPAGSPGGGGDFVVISTGAGDDTIDLGSQNHFHGVYVDGGFGDDTIVGGFGAATFNFDSGLGGNDVIVDFRGLARGESDKIDLHNLTNVHSLSDLIHLGDISQDGADVVITDRLGSFLTLTNVSLGSLQSGDFIFAPPGF